MIFSEILISVTPLKLNSEKESDLYVTKLVKVFVVREITFTYMRSYKVINKYIK